jgi:hypothetical protein
MPLDANTAPYYDDFDESKQYYQIMFNPGRPVQARELTQMQTMLQKQIERFGDHVFQHGARVLGGSAAYEKCRFIQLADNQGNNAANPLIDITGLYNSTTLLGAKLVLDEAVETATDGDGNTVTSDGRAPVATVVFAVARDGSTPNTLLINYETEDEFAAGDTIKSVTDATFTTAVTNAVVAYDTLSSASAAVGSSMFATVSEGVFYVKSSTGTHFVHCPQQRIVLSNYNTTGTYSVGLGINEEFITETSDNTLYDNAGGVNQPTAPGAHRLKIDLELKVKPGSNGSTVPEGTAADYFELLRVESGRRIYSTASSDASSRVYSKLGDAMADRTYHAEGNFVVEPFECRVEETNPPSAQLKVTVSPARGKDIARAYVNGREFGLAGDWTQYIDKARDTGIKRDLVAPTPIGASIVVKDLQVSDNLGEGVLAAGELPVWDMHTVASGGIDTNSEDEYNSTRIGSFRLRDLKTAGRFGNTAAQNVHTVYIQDFKSANAITGPFDGNATNDGQTVTIDQTDTSFSDIDNAYIGCRITITGSSVDANKQYANQTRSITSYTASSGDITLDKPFNQPPSDANFPSATETFSLVLEPTAAMTGDGSIVPSPYVGHGVTIASSGAYNASRVVSANAQMMNSADGFANTHPIRGGDQVSLLFPLETGGARVANSIAEGVTGGSIHYIARYSATTTSGALTRTFNADQFRDISASFTEFVEGTTVENVVVVVEDETTPYIINSADITTFTPSSTNIQITSDLINDGDTIRLYAPVLVSNVKAKRKSLRNGWNTTGTTHEITTNRSNGHVVFTSPNQIPGQADNLGMPDVYRIRAIYTTADTIDAPTDAILTEANDISSRYTFDNGQREDLYDYASVTLKPGAPAPVGQLLVVFDYFAHTDDTGATVPEGGYFSVDSYHNQVSLDNIPSFVSKTSGFRYNLKDYIDFRPCRATDMTGTTAADTSYHVPIVATPGSDPTSATPIGHVDASGAFFYWMQYFGARFDKIILGDRSSSAGANTGTMQIVSGSSDKTPATMPKVSDKDLTLFTLAIPSYTKQASDVDITKEHSRRYTMTDINKLEKRIQRLERISTLNQIETQTAGLKVVDDNGIEFFKNGILVDTFEGLASSDTGVPGAPNIQFNASVGGGMLRPPVEQDNIDLVISPTDSSDYFAKNNVLMLPFTTTQTNPGLSQFQATQGGAENINPFQIQAFYGTMSLTPSSDNWHSTRDLPISASDRTQARLAAESMVQQRLDRGEGNVRWGSWESEWFGSEVTTTEFFRDPEAAYQYVIDNPPPRSGWVDQVLQRDADGNEIWNPVDGYSYRSYDQTGARPGIYNLRDVSPNAAPQSEYAGGEIDYVSFSIARDNTNPFVTAAGQVNVTDELIQRTITTGTGIESRTGQQTQFDIVENSTIVDDVSLSDIVAPYMRPVDITFRGEGMKPRTTVYPMFDNVLVTNYTERANELVLRQEPASSAYVNPFGDLREEEVLGSAAASSTGAGIAVGQFANTVYLTSANGTFVSGDSIVRSTTTDTPSVRVVKYKQFSGRVLTYSSGTTTVKLFDSRANGQEHWRTTSVSARATNLDEDLYGRTLYIVEGRGYGQSATITEFDETSGEVVIDAAFTLNPDTNSRFSIGEHFTNYAGKSYGVFHVPNYSYANRTAQEYTEANVTGDLYWTESAQSDQRTNDTLRFASGRKTFGLRSSPSPLEADLTTHVEAVFSSSGVIDTRQYRSVFDIETRTVSVTENREISRTSTNDVSLGQHLLPEDSEFATVKYFDPVAQSFVVDPNLYPEGIMINAVDIWFETKHRTDAGTQLPVILEVRPTIAGVPSGSKVLASKSLLPDEVTTTLAPARNTDATKFTFDRPLMLEAGKEYAIVLRSDSLDYTVWTAKMGDPLVGTGGTTGIPERIVDKQAALGSFFKSQNGVTWEPEQTQDLMFAVDKCVFTPNQVATVIWKNANAHSDSSAEATTRLNSPLSHTNLTNVTGSAASTPYGNSNEFKLWQSDYEFDEFRVDTTTLEFPTSTVNWEYDCVDEDETQVPNVFDLEFNETDGYNPMVLGQSTIHPVNRLKILKDKTGSFVLRGKLSTTSTDISPIVNLERIGLTMFRNIVNDGGLHANTWPYSQVYTGDNTIVGGGFVIKDGGATYTNASAITVAAATGSPGGGATGTAIVKGDGTGEIIGFTLTNAGESYIATPTITVAGGDGNADIEYLGETNPAVPGNFPARYVSKRVRLQQGVESRDIRVILKASLPEGTNVHVYAKVRSASDDLTFDDHNWQLLARGRADSTQIAGDRGDTRELTFRGTGDDDTYPFAYVTTTDDAAAGDGERYTTFNEFAIKIVMSSQDSRYVPVVYDMRAIAVE